MRCHLTGTPVDDSTIERNNPLAPAAEINEFEKQREAQTSTILADEEEFLARAVPRASNVTGEVE
ncbi:MAG: hypothetical protein GY724_14350 [Actinomycetia bacterium]|nr:hypothetical protein [Actinomycetes bacterium]MCP5030939.1 hypothetical protein [Actinomycetes bacterium]